MKKNNHNHLNEMRFIKQEGGNKTKMQRGKLGLIALLALFAMLFSAAAVMAAEGITWNNPNAATDIFTTSTVYDEGQLNITTTGQVNVTNCSFYMSASDTNQTAQRLIGTNSTTNNVTVWTVKYNASFDQDSANVVFNASCTSYNATPFSSQQQAKIDGAHTPTAATGVRPANNVRLEQDTRTVSFSGTVTDADANACYIQFSGTTPGSLIYAKNNLTTGNTNCTITIANFPEGTYKFAFFSSDGINVTRHGSDNLFTVEFSGGTSAAAVYQAGKQVEEQQQQAASSGSKTKTLVIIIAAIIVITQIMKNNGGKKRR